MTKADLILPRTIEFYTPQKVVDWLERDDFAIPLAISEVDVTPVLKEILRSVQDHLFTDCVDFYKRAIRSGCTPPPSEGISDGKFIYLTDGTHRATAWIELGWHQVPVRIWGPQID